MDVMAIKMDAQYKELQSCAKQPSVSFRFLTEQIDDDIDHVAVKKKLNVMANFSSNSKTSKLSRRDSLTRNMEHLRILFPALLNSNPMSNQSVPTTAILRKSISDCRIQPVSGKSYNPPDNPDDQQNNSENLINFDSDDEDDEPTPQPKTQPTKPN
ncbi:hypothetical protein Tco_0732419 [Tanacetum coccineum]